MSDDAKLVMMTIAIVVLVSMVIVFGPDPKHAKLMQQAIEQGFAQYDLNEKTGESAWRWKTKEEVCDGI